MNTRSSPSLSVLHKLAEAAGMPSGFEKLSKRGLYVKLQEQYNFDRLKRAAIRGSTAYRKRGLPPITAHDFEFSEVHNCGSSSSSSSSSSSTIQNSSGSNSFGVSVSSNTAPRARMVRSSRKRPLASSSSSSSGPRKRREITASDIGSSSDVVTLDPIMHEPIREGAFEYVRPNGTIALFNIDSLVDYMLSTGDFCDPETRIPFDNSVLQAIDAHGKKQGLKKPSVLARCRDPQAYNDMMFRRDALLGLERTAGEVVSDILDIIENAEDVEEAQMCLFMREFPLFSDYYRQIKEADAHFALACLKTWTAYIKGPPNRPTDDPFGLLHSVLHFISAMDE